MTGRINNQPTVTSAIDAVARWARAGISFEHWRDSSGVVNAAIICHAAHWLVRGSGPTHEDACIDLARQLDKMRQIEAAR